MKININWKLFVILLITTVITTLLVLPYTLALSPALAEVFTPFVLIAQLIQTLVIFSIAIFIGLLLVKRVGFNLPILEGWLEGKEVGTYLKSILGISIGLGNFSRYNNYFSKFHFYTSIKYFSECRNICPTMERVFSVFLWRHSRRNIT